MSQDQEIVSNDTEQVTGSEDSQEQQIQESQDTVKYESFQKLLSQKKNSDKKVKELEARLQEMEQGQIDDAPNEKKADLALKLKKQIEQKAIELKEKERAFYRKHIERQVADYARDLGCQDPNRLLRVISDDVEGLEFDGETLEVDRFSLKSILDNAKKEMPYFFNRTAPKVKDAAKIGINKNEINIKKPLSQMSKEEIEAELRKLK